jgi:hypothetical protein
MLESGDIWVAERVPARLVCRALISLINTRRSISRRPELLWLKEDALRNGLRRLILNNRWVRFSVVETAEIIEGLRGYTPSTELGMFLTNLRGTELYIMPRAAAPVRNPQYNVGVIAPPSKHSERYVTTFRRAGTTIEERTPAPTWLVEAQQIIAQGRQD